MPLRDVCDGMGQEGAEAEEEGKKKEEKYESEEEETTGDNSEKIKKGKGRWSAGRRRVRGCESAVTSIWRNTIMPIS